MIEFDAASESCLLPPFAARLASPEIRNIMLCGCGGGFDFVHGLALLPELKRLGKRVVIGSYSFSDPQSFEGESSVVFEEGYVQVRRVSAAHRAPPQYGPEVHVASFLDTRFPPDAPHEVYAYDARQFTVPLLRRLYAQLVEEHELDAIVLVDGGSDALMVGDESGLGTPVEDHVALTTVASLDDVPVKILLVAGLGCDRFHGVTDAATLRAIAELTAAGGFLGVSALEPGNPGFCLLRDCVDHVFERQRIRSVVAGATLAAGEGMWGADDVPERLRTRVRENSLFVWPLMGMLWAFDVGTVCERSWIGDWIEDEATPWGCYDAIRQARAALGKGIRPVESLPLPADFRAGTRPRGAPGE